MTQEVMEPVQRLSQDLRLAAITLSEQEVRYLVDYYYIMQEDRKRAANQMRALGETEPTEEPHSVISWVAANSGVLERNVKSVLERYAKSKVPGEWAMTIPGIGPIIASGLLAHVNIEMCPTVGKLWSFAGQNPEAVWEKGQKRPWNARLKLVCFHIGECLIRAKSAKDGEFYGDLFDERKAYEWARNIGGELVDQAVAKLVKFNIGTDTDAHKWYKGRVTAEAAAVFLAESGDSQRKPKLVAAGEGLPMAVS
ncbi:hypothetical protein LCGC14_1757780 [marine sediment metagenome]|uniref:Uncharacterized protein n=1 Tax=marine sediment metagenome TaxID=412755 RepID=A0A0F9HP93_9ZZZZ